MSLIYFLCYQFPLLCVRDEFSGLEGMVKMKTLDENDFSSNANLAVVEVSKSHGNDSNHEKRCCAIVFVFLFNLHLFFYNHFTIWQSMNLINKLLPIIRTNAPHRSLPDIPNAGDNNSDLYATVGDKVNQKPQGKESRMDEVFLIIT